MAAGEPFRYPLIRTGSDRTPCPADSELETKSQSRGSVFYHFFLLNHETAYPSHGSVLVYLSISPSVGIDLRDMPGLPDRVMPQGYRRAKKVKQPYSPYSGPASVLCRVTTSGKTSLFAVGLVQLSLLCCVVLLFRNYGHITGWMFLLVYQMHYFPAQF